MRRSDRLAAKVATRAAAPAPAAGEQPAEVGPVTPPPRRRPAPARQPRRRGAAATRPGLPPPEVLLIVLKRVEPSAARWKTAAALALAGAFGPRPRAHLEPFWLEQARVAAEPGTAPLCGPFTTVKELKGAAAAAGLLSHPSTGITRAQLEAMVPQSVPPAIIAAVRADRLRRRVDADVRAAGRDVDLGALITLTRAKQQYRLSDADMEGLPYRTAPNPHYRSAAPMQLYTLRDVVRASYEKHGGAAGLAAAAAAAKRRKEAAKDRRRDVDAELEAAGLGELKGHHLVAQHRARGKPGLASLLAALRRQRALAAALAARGLALRADSKLCEAYIETGEGDVAGIVDTMDEMRFYMKYTRYEQYRERVRRDDLEWKGYYDAVEVSEAAKSEAWRDVKARKGRDWLLDLPDLPRDMRRELEEELNMELAEWSEGEEEEEEEGQGEGAGGGVGEGAASAGV